MKVPWYMKLKGPERYFVLPEIYNVFNWRRAAQNRLCSWNRFFFFARLEHFSNIFRFTVLFLLRVAVSLFFFL